ncbi:inorganic phosphate transporter PitA [Jinshanibacter sp. LJY008]|uniref:Phosphate transporter n=1 Tax=Limnobaculum eriocheiris TaxID=2897391 RepID=A0A9X1MYW7_9GAMM|nr:inorganic phosphate transporter PitA [Limnobaculum eriocheiris]MCD1127389.1 inorganic phosphate transporter PitA [Limnobaculum eriocheiris]
MLNIFAGLEIHTALMLGLALLFVLFYEAINGFHDTANAVATVIYTRAMREQLAVVMAGVFNFLGVVLGGLSVAYAIVHLLPTDLLLNISSTHGLAMMFSVLLAAIIWNLGTWYLGIPASSSHTLIGSIIGVGLTNAIVTDSSIVDALNLPKMIQIFLSLILSPLVGLILAGAMIFILRRFWSGNKKRQRIHLTPAEREKKDGKRKPPFWTRIMLILSAIGVSFSHGANDGQKGIGLLMLVLIGVAPAGFVVDMSANGYDISRTRDALGHLEQYYQNHRDAIPHIVGQNNTDPLPAMSTSTEYHCDNSRALIAIGHSQQMLSGLDNYEQLPPDQRSQLRRLLLCVADSAAKVTKLPETSSQDKRYIKELREDVLVTVEYAPIWIIVSVALALALGTMVGWRRVAVTIGEKIGKKGMTYAQGVSAQLTAALSIGVASYTGMPVSTTQVLSSAVAGTMLVDGGGIQSKTVKSIFLAWALTLPVAVLLSGSLYWIALKLI